MWNIDRQTSLPALPVLLCCALAGCAGPPGQLVLVNRSLADAVADFNRNNCNGGRHIIVLDPALGRKTLVGQYPLNAPEMFARDVSALLNVPVDIGHDHIAIGVR